jgi:hypothetical protein
MMPISFHSEPFDFPQGKLREESALLADQKSSRSRFFVAEFLLERSEGLLRMTTHHFFNSLPAGCSKTLPEKQ